MAGKDIDGAWPAFFTTHVPVLEKEGWKIDIGSDFGTRMIEPTGEVGVVVRDAGEGWFDMDIGVEIDGQRRPLLPILARLIDRGGMAATKVSMVRRSLCSMTVACWRCPPGAWSGCSACLRRCWTADAGWMKSFRCHWPKPIC